MVVVGFAGSISRAECECRYVLGRSGWSGVEGTGWLPKWDSSVDSQVDLISVSCVVGREWWLEENPVRYHVQNQSKNQEASYLSVSLFTMAIKQLNYYKPKQCRVLTQRKLYNFRNSLSALPSHGSQHFTN